MNLIRKNLYLGSADDAKRLIGSGITAILNVAIEVPSYRHCNVLSVKSAMRDEAEDARAKSKTIVASLNELLNEGHCVLVHCKQGKSRSAHIVAQCLAERENRDYFETYEEVRSLRPQVMSYSIGEEIVAKYGKKDW